MHSHTPLPASSNQEAAAIEGLLGMGGMGVVNDGVLINEENNNEEREKEFDKFEHQ